jgi:hypothetical protein
MSVIFRNISDKPFIANIGGEEIRFEVDLVT